MCEKKLYQCNNAHVPVFTPYIIPLLPMTSLKPLQFTNVVCLEDYMGICAFSTTNNVCITGTIVFIKIKQRLILKL